jgi:multidrug efflux pump
MRRIAEYAIDHARLTLATLLFLLLAGFVAYMTIPKEAEPDVRIPIVYVELQQRGISPEDSERLLLRPLETKLKSVSNVKEMRSTAFEGGGFVLLEFEAGFDSNAALADVRAKVDEAKSDLPRDAEEPTVHEVNLSAFRSSWSAFPATCRSAPFFKSRAPCAPMSNRRRASLQRNCGAARDEVVEIVAEPMLMNSYGISIDDLISITQSSTPSWRPAHSKANPAASASRFRRSSKSPRTC